MCVANMLKSCTLVIPVFNEEKRIHNLLNKYNMVQNILLLDNYSTDKTIELALNIRPGITVVKSKNNGSPGTTNIMDALGAVKTEWCMFTIASETYPYELLKELDKITSKHNEYDAVRIYRQSYTAGIKTHVNRVLFKRLLLKRYVPSGQVFRVKLFDSESSRIHQEFTIKTNWDRIKILDPILFNIKHARSFDPRTNVIKSLEYARIEALDKYNSGYTTSVLKIILKPSFLFLYYTIRDIPRSLGMVNVVVNMNHAYYTFITEYYVAFYSMKRNCNEA